MSTKTKPASTDTAEVARSYFEAVGRQDVDAMEAHYEPGGGGPIHGLVDLKVGENYRGWFETLFRAFPDWKFEILNLVADGERAAVEWRATATFDGDARFEGLDPNGAKLDIQGCDMVTIRDGRISRIDAYASGTEIARQLGALPPQGSAAERAMTAALNLKTRATKALRRD
ncbi:MAG: ester cyclase [Actinomycetota bacterium]|nr:ester cyclase [Actinomycetota bacterium]